MHCQLTNKSVIQLSGDDRQTFLQGQITADLNKLETGSSALACMCSAKGKTWGILQILAMEDTYLLITDSGCLENCLRELKKYAVFSKVEISDVSAEYQFSGITSEEFPAEILTLMEDSSLPEQNLQSEQVIINDQSVWITRYTNPHIRWVVVYPAKSSIGQLLSALPSGSPEDWEALDIQAGIPKLAAEQSEEYVPQMMNLQALNAISFTKGCYMGQEVVARTKYLGKNKRAGAILVSDNNFSANSGATLELKLGENWRRIGTCLYSANSENKSWIFAVLPNDLEADAVLRLQDSPDLIYRLFPLPYALDEDVPKGN